MASSKSTNAEFTELSPTAWKVVVTIPAEKFNKHLNKMYDDISKNVNIPGFRPGKAPRNVINRHYNRQHIISETCDEVIKDSLWPAINEKELMITGPPKVDFDDWVEGQDFKYSAIFEIVPTIPQIDYSEINVTLPERKFNDDTLAEELRRISIKFGETKKITDRPVQKGDIVRAGFEGEVADVLVDTLDGEAPWKVTDENMNIEVGAGKALEGIESRLEGMSLEEIKDIEFVLPDDFTDRKVRGKTIKGKLHVKGIVEAAPAELTDGFLKEKLGDQKIETLDQLKERVRQEVENTWRQMDERLTIDQIEVHLSRMFDFPLPEGLVREKYDNFLDRTLDSLKKDGGDPAKLMAADNPVGVKIRKRARYQAERVVRMELIMLEIARKEAIGVANDEVANYLMMLAMRQGIQEKDLRALMQDRTFIDNTRDELLQKKVTHFLLSKVKPEKVPEDDFKAWMEKARDEGESHESQFVKESSDPILLKVDYLDDPDKVRSGNDADEDGTVGDGSGENPGDTGTADSSVSE